VSDSASDAPITVLITDVEGSTDLQSRLGDTAARELMRRHEDDVRAALAAHDGREIKTMGDGFLATFTSTRRAIECATAIQAAGGDLRIRIGMHCGEVIHESGDIFGAAVAAASRIMAQARGGEIVVSDLVRQLAGTAGVTFRERTRVSLKGLDGQWLLHDVLPHETVTAAAPLPESTLIGREVETTLLHSAVDDAMAGRGRLVLLAGEPGIGKTTLATNAGEHATKQGARVTWGACWEGEGAPAFWPWIQVIRTCAADLTDDELVADVGSGVAELCRLVPELAARLPEMSEPPQLDPEQARFRLFDAVASFIWRVAARRPLMIVLDDLHWADESSMRLLTFVAAQLGTHALMVAGTYRDTEVGADHALAPLLHDASRRGQLLSVRGLAAEDVAQLMASTAGGELRADLAAAVHRQTAGNPLFVGEMTRLLAAQNALDRDDVSVGVPQGVREVIERRMVRLPQPCIDVLTLAAVAGEEFALDIVARAGAVRVPEVVELLDTAMAAGVVREAGTGRYRFAHALFREALYEGQGRIARAGLHLQIANALEERYLETGEGSTAELANHFGLAALTGETDKAVRYAVLAGGEASTAVAYAEAVGHFQRALEVLDLAPHPTEGERSEILLELSGARWRAGDRAGARAEVDRSINLARRTGRGDVLARAALALHRLGGISGVEDNERLRLLDEASRALEGEETPLRVRILAALAKEQYHAWLHSPESMEGAGPAEEAVALARKLGDDRVLAEALAALHDNLWFSGQEVRRLDVATELERVATAVGDREQAVEAVLLQAVALLELADPQAVPRLETFVVDAAAFHQPRFAYLVATRRVTLATIRGDIDGAERALDDAAAIAAEHGEPDHLNVSAAQLFMVATLKKDRMIAVERARQAYRTNRAYAQMIDATTSLGFLDQGDADRAREAFWRIDFDDLGSRFKNYGWLHQMTAVGEAAAKLGETEVLDRLVAALEPYADRCTVVAGAVCFGGSAAHCLGLMTQALGRQDEAAAYFAQALAAYERLDADAWASRTRDAMGMDADAADAADAAVVHELTGSRGSWTFAFDGATVSVADSKGLRDLAVLLSAPGKEVAAADLMVRGDVAAAGADAVLDDRARAEFGARLAELDDDLVEAEAANDLERISRVKAERDMLAHELAAAMGLGGRARKLGDPSERARKAVAARLRDAVEKIAAQHADLGQHLRASVRTGTFCAYAPPSPTAWRVTNNTTR
jgi:predicted ATPase